MLGRDKYAYDRGAVADRGVDEGVDRRSKRRVSAIVISITVAGQMRVIGKSVSIPMGTDGWRGST